MGDAADYAFEKAVDSEYAATSLRPIDDILAEQEEDPQTYPFTRAPRKDASMAPPSAPPTAPPGPPRNLPPPPRSAPSASAPAKSTPSKLGKLTAQTVVPRIILNAVEGWGKTSLVAHMPAPAIFMARGETGYKAL